MGHYLIIAGSSAIGQAVASALKDRGDTFFSTARSESKIKADMILDATDFENVKEAFRQAGALDGVVNCSGSLLLKNAHSTKKNEYQQVIDASLTTAFATVHAAGSMMKHGGSVVLISSAAALVGLANHEAVSAAKAAIIGLARSAAASYANSNLRINVVAPGMVDTPLTQNLMTNEAFYNASKAMHPLGRIGSVNDIARAVLFFLNPENSWITGQVLCVDGGLSQIRPKIKL
ncbi:SDR family NAD(P)-dependent oxidoreductase [Legionella hackeliae]|uniref:2-deoxy-D-gluconate-3-dehydrogenase n=1 Tax=Legionella hackeliae TaxID=449 RepID=A0A0A8URM1_LEGHA|nr:SDR family oxidoreductase [Legionella hackeliae]KTD13178.1 oxydoreductase [Legionella hackeliae]CEK11510.1 2-deoxy-D-gluconate-3-dehydrogenase [Legionella hackeliae]STX48278.1 oxydoreductase [Legionella hackeliae]